MLATRAHTTTHWVLDLPSQMLICRTPRDVGTTHQVHTLLQTCCWLVVGQRWLAIPAQIVRAHLVIAWVHNL